MDDYAGREAMNRLRQRAEAARQAGAFIAPVVFAAIGAYRRGGLAEHDWPSWDRLGAGERDDLIAMLAWLVAAGPHRVTVQQLYRHGQTLPGAGWVPGSPGFLRRDETRVAWPQLPIEDRRSWSLILNIARSLTTD